MRLSRRVAELAGCSRREAELYIEGGWVRVNGVVQESPQHRVQDDTVALDPAARQQPPVTPTPVTMVLHKPPGCISHAAPGQPQAAIDWLQTERHDPRDRSGIRPLQRHWRGLEPVTPLETGASGLVVFTQDWRVKRKLVDDAALVEHEIMVDVRGTVAPPALQQLNRAPWVEGRAGSSARVSVNRQSGEVTGLRFALKGYEPGQLAQRCSALDLEILAIRRMRMGRLPLAGLPEGQWRYLAPHERF